MQTLLYKYSYHFISSQLNRKYKPYSKMLKGLFTFGLGVYTGLYLAQNYEVPRVDEPGELLQKIKDFADKHRKP